MKNSIGGNVPGYSLPHKNLDEVGTNVLYLSDLSVDTLAVNCWRNLTGDSCFPDTYLGQTRLIV